MGKMAASRQVQPQKGIARLHQGEKGRDIGGGPRMRLNVCETASEKLRNTLNRQIFGNVDVLAAAIIALARLAFGIFVGEDRALRLEHRGADIILRGDQLDIVLLSA